MLANSERYYVQKQGVSEIRLQQADEVCKCLKSLAALTKETYMKCKHLSYQPVYNYSNKKKAQESQETCYLRLFLRATNISSRAPTY